MPITPTCRSPDRWPAPWRACPASAGSSRTPVRRPSRAWSSKPARGWAAGSTCRDHSAISTRNMTNTSPISPTRRPMSPNSARSRTRRNSPAAPRPAIRCRWVRATSIWAPRSAIAARPTSSRFPIPISIRTAMPSSMRAWSIPRRATGSASGCTARTCSTRNTRPAATPSSPPIRAPGRSRSGRTGSRSRRSARKAR